MTSWQRLTSSRLLKRLTALICITAVVQCLNMALIQQRQTYEEDSPDGAMDSHGRSQDQSDKERERFLERRRMKSLRGFSKYASLQTSTAAILDQMADDWHWEWIRGRIQHTWDEVVMATRKLYSEQKSSKRSLKKIFVVPGVLTQTDFADPESIRNGGPLGDLLQWADLISGLHALGHDVTIHHSLLRGAQELMTSYLLSQLENITQPEGCKDREVDLIYTDIGGWQAFHPSVKEHYKHKVRILDAFGTEAMYNYPDYAFSHGIDLTGKGGMALKLKQFYTFYPHTPDNSFLGFIVPENKFIHNKTAKRNIAVLYGKEARYAQGKSQFLNVLLRLVEVHSTMDSVGPVLPDGVQNHGVLSHQDYQQLAASAKIFIGLGAPIEANGVMESLARGCIFFNPRIKSTRFFGKPTSRQPSSQMPYLEQYVGRPHVFTIDYDNLTEVTLAVRQALSLQVAPLLPFEFSAEGFIQRLDAYVQKQDFCHDGSAPWPPISALSVHVAPRDVDCKQHCQQQGLLCEPSFFHLLNDTAAFKSQDLPCSRTVVLPELYSPGYQEATKTCFLQQTDLLYSCVGSDYHVTRLCPCRGFRKFQVALCERCL